MADDNDLRTILAARQPVPCVTTPDGRPAWYPDTAVLTVNDVAALLEIHPKTAAELPLKWSYATDRRKIVLYRHLVAFLEQRAAA